MGMKTMADARLKKLKELWLSNYFYDSDGNSIGSVGVKLLIKADFSMLQQLWLCNWLIIQAAAAWGMKEPDI